MCARALIFNPMLTNRSLPRFLAIALLAPVISFAQSVPPGWDKLENCRLVPGEYFDGDSFWVLHEGKKHIFRLYFIDCPETDASVPQRISDQMRDFGLSSEAGVLKAGDLATEFVRKRLSGSFTVLTKWEDARGRSRQQRFYAVIFVGSKNLIEELMQAGLARAYGMPADFPNTARAKAFRDSLRRMEANAIRQKLGAFAGTSRVLAAGEVAVPEREYVDYEDEIGGSILNKGILDIDPLSGFE